VIFSANIVIDLIKKHWKEIGLVLLLIIVYFNGSAKYSSLYKMHEETINQYNIRIGEMEEAHKEQIEKKDEAIKQYIQRVEDLRIEYLAEKEVIEDSRDKKRRDYKKTLQEKPETLIKEIEEKFGFEYVE